MAVVKGLTFRRFRCYFRRLYCTVLNPYFSLNGLCRRVRRRTFQNDFPQSKNEALYPKHLSCKNNNRQIMRYSKTVVATLRLYLTDRQDALDSIMCSFRYSRTISRNEFNIMYSLQPHRIIQTIHALYLQLRTPPNKQSF